MHDQQSIREGEDQNTDDSSSLLLDNRKLFKQRTGESTQHPTIDHRTVYNMNCT